MLYTHYINVHKLRSDTSYRDTWRDHAEGVTGQTLDDEVCRDVVGYRNALATFYFVYNML